MAKVVGYFYIAAGLYLNYVAQGTGTWLIVAGQAILVGESYRDNRKAQRRARDQYNASLKDRLEMVDITADQPRTVVYGRVRTVEGVRRKWVSGDNSEKLTMVVSFAGHEIDGFEQFYFNDIPLSLDGSGYVTTEPFFKGAYETVQERVILDMSGSYTGTLSQTPVADSLFVQVYVAGGDGGGVEEVDFTLVGTTITLTSSRVGRPCDITYQYATGRSTARIRSWTGASGQNVGAAIAADYPGKITSTDKFAGMAVAVIDIDYDPDIYVQGRPNVTARLRGKKVLDPRTSTTAWTENPALHAYDFQRLVNGGAVPAADIVTADIQAAADACEVSTVFTLRTAAGDVSTVTLPRYRCGTVLNTASDPGANLDEIMETMAGRHGWAGGQWRMRAGVMASPVDTVTPAWLAQRMQPDGTTDSEPVVRISNGVPREQRVNRVTGTCVNPSERWQILPFPAIQDAVLIAAKGEAALEVELGGVNHIAHAQHLGSIMIRQAQASMRMELACNLYAWRTEIFDVLNLQLPRYGMAGNTAEVTGWRWHPTEGVTLKLAETSDAIYTPVSELVGLDPAPNSDLPSPWQVEQVTGLAVTSGTALLVDGSILTRTQVTWDDAISQAVRASGKVQIQYVEISDPLPEEWQTWEESGSATSAIIPALRSGYTYLFRARFVSGPPLGVRGKWSLQTAHTIAMPPLAVGRYTDIIFKRSASAPSTPTGPGTPTGWYGAPPTADGNPLWVSFADKNADGTLIGVWSTPVQIDGESLQVEYSVDGSTGWHGTFTPGDLYAHYRIGASGTWSDPVKIVGEDGNSTSFIFKRSASAPATPTGDTPAGWSDDPPAADGNPLWVSAGTKTPGGSLLGVWSTPIQLEGDGIEVEYSVDGVTGWHGTFTTGDIWARYRVGPTGSWSDAVKIVGEDGANGRRTARLDFYRWSATTPTTFPSGTSTYTWASATYTAPATLNSWAITPPAAVAGQTLYACTVFYTDTNTTTTTNITVAPSTAYAIGKAGGDGARGTVQRYVDVSPSTTWSDSVATASVPSAAPITGDTVTEYNAAGTFAQTRTYTGSAWALPGTVIDGSVLVNGTVTAAKINVVNLAALSANLGTVTSGNVNTSGYVKISGASSFTLDEPVPSGFIGTPSSKTISLVANASGGSDVGVVGLCTVAGGYGGYFASSANNPALVAFQQNAGSSSGALKAVCVNGYAVQAQGGTVGVTSQAYLSGGVAIEGRTNGANGSTGVAVKADASAGGTALQAIGASTFTSTSSVTLTSTSSSTGTALRGISAGASGTAIYADASAGGFALYVNGALRWDTTPDTGSSATASFTGTKPGSLNNSNAWLLFNIGTQVWGLPAWRIS